MSASNAPRKRRIPQPAAGFPVAKKSVKNPAGRSAPPTLMAAGATGLHQHQPPGSIPLDPASAHQMPYYCAAGNQLSPTFLCGVFPPPYGFPTTAMAPSAVMPAGFPTVYTTGAGGTATADVSGAKVITTTVSPKAGASEWHNGGMQSTCRPLCCPPASLGTCPGAARGVEADPMRPRPMGPEVLATGMVDGMGARTRRPGPEMMSSAAGLAASSASCTTTNTNTKTTNSKKSTTTTTTTTATTTANRLEQPSDKTGFSLRVSGTSFATPSDVTNVGGTATSGPSQPPSASVPPATGFEGVDNWASSPLDDDDDDFADFIDCFLLTESTDQVSETAAKTARGSKVLHEGGVRSFDEGSQEQ